MEDDPTESRNSEYEFAELEEAQGVMNDVNEVPEHHQNAVDVMEPLNDEGIVLEPGIQRLDYNVIMVLTHYNVDQQVIENFGIHGITFDQLRYLGDGDLEELGIANADQRTVMLDDFQNYPQRRYPPGGYPRQELSVIDFIHQQLQRMDILLAASIINISTNRLVVHAPGIVLNNPNQQFFSPDAVLHLLGLLTNRIADMHQIVANLRDENAINRIFRRIQRNKMKGKLFTYGFGILMFGAGVLIHRRFGAK